MEVTPTKTKNVSDIIPLAKMKKYLLVSHPMLGFCMAMTLTTIARKVSSNAEILKGLADGLILIIRRSGAFGNVATQRKSTSAV